METILIGVGTSFAFLVTLAGAIGLRGIAQHATKVDVLGTLLIYFMFAGTSTLGILVAMWAGLAIAIFTRIIKALVLTWPPKRDPKTQPATKASELTMAEIIQIATRKRG